MTLSTDSIDKAIKRIKEYREEVKLNAMFLMNELTDKGIEVIEAHKISEGDADFNDLRSYVEMDYQGVTCTAKLILEGKDVAFIEFGAGVHFNGSVGSGTELGAKLGYTIGSYGFGQGRFDSWQYTDESGTRVTTHGVKAAKPLEYADEAIRNEFVQAAKRVFGND